MWLGVGAVVFGAALTIPDRGLWEPDEPRYAEVAREMLEEGRWLVPHLHGEPYGHKPPVFMWLVAGVRAVGAPWTVAGTLPSLVASLVLLVAMPAMAPGLGLSREEGRWASAILAASPLAGVMALATRMDVLLMVSHAAVVWLVVRQLRAPSADRRSHDLIWLATAAGVLVKGPVALALMLATVLAIWLALGRKPGIGRIFSGRGPFLFAAVVAAWLVPAIVAGGPGYTHEILVRQSVGRIVGSFAHQQPFFFHVATYPLSGVPFSVVALFAVVRGLRKRSSGPETMLSAAFAAVIGFMSLMSGKLVLYLLPLFPVAAFLVARELRDEGGAGRRLPLALSAFATGLMGAGLALAPAWRDEISDHRFLPLAAGLAVLVPALVALGAVAARRLEPAVGALLVSGMVFPSVVVPVAVTLYDRRMSVEPVAELLTERDPEAATAPSYGEVFSGLPLYTGRPLEVLRDPETLVERIVEGRLVVVHHKHWDDVEAAVEEAGGSKLFTFPYRRTTIHIVGIAESSAGRSRTAARSSPPS